MIQGSVSMDTKKLFEAQVPLREKIIKRNNLEGQELLPNLILSFLVELGELANCWRGFKHWSLDKKMRKGEALDEYADGISFILEIGLELGFTDIDNWYPFPKEKTITNQFIECKGRAYNLYFQNRVTGNIPREMFEYLFSTFLGLGEMLGFTWEEIEEAYFAKNAVNHQRQESGY